MLGSEMQVWAHVSANATTLTGFKFFGIRVSLRDRCASSIGDNSTLIAGNGGGGGGGDLNDETFGHPILGVAKQV